MAYRLFLRDANAVVAVRKRTWPRTVDCCGDQTKAIIVMVSRTAHRETPCIVTVGTDTETSGLFRCPYCAEAVAPFWRETN
jgi:hypothetical protein